MSPYGWYFDPKFDLATLWFVATRLVGHISVHWHITMYNAHILNPILCPLSLWPNALPDNGGIQWRAINDSFRYSDGFGGDPPDSKSHRIDPVDADKHIRCKINAYFKMSLVTVGDSETFTVCHSFQKMAGAWVGPTGSSAPLSPPCRRIPHFPRHHQIGIRTYPKWPHLFHGQQDFLFWENPSMKLIVKKMIVSGSQTGSFS